MDISEIVKNYRKSHGLSMDAFAKQCGVSKAYIGFIESGVNPKTGKPIVPTIETVKKMATGMRISLDEFVRMMDDNSMINAGVNIVAVSKRLGHASIEQTLKTYTHLLQSTDQQMMDEIKKLRKSEKVCQK